MYDSLSNRKVRTLDSTIRVFQERDLNSPVICQVPQGVEIELGAASEFEGREWFEAALPNEVSGYVLGPGVRGHTAAADTAFQHRSVPGERNADKRVSGQMPGSAVEPSATAGPAATGRPLLLWFLGMDLVLITPVGFSFVRLIDSLTYATVNQEIAVMRQAGTIAACLEAALGAFAVWAGVKLWRKDVDALEFARLFLLGALALDVARYAVFSLLLRFAYEGLFSHRESWMLRDSALSDLLWTIPRTLFWLIYISRSRRVKAFLAGAPVQQEVAPRRSKRADLAAYGARLARVALLISMTVCFPLVVALNAGHIWVDSACRYAATGRIALTGNLLIGLVAILAGLGLWRASDRAVRNAKTFLIVATVWAAVQYGLWIALVLHRQGTFMEVIPYPNPRAFRDFGGSMCAAQAGELLVLTGALLGIWWLFLVCGGTQRWARSCSSSGNSL